MIFARCIDEVMELKELTDKTLEMFECKNTNELKEKILSACINNETTKFDSFLNLINGDLETDYLQKIFQYYEADRKSKGQDYTPKSLAKLVSMLSYDEKEETCLDMCCGTGALTIQKWKEDKDLQFELEEYDENVIPFLLFNMMIRNIKAIVRQKDVLQDETFKEYSIRKGDKFGICEVIK